MLICLILLSSLISTITIPDTRNPKNLKYRYLQLVKNENGDIQTEVGPEPEKEVDIPQPQKLDPEFKKFLLDTAPSKIKDLAQLVKEQFENNTSISRSHSALLIGSNWEYTPKLVQAIAENANANFYLINCLFLEDTFINSGPQNLKRIFEKLLAIDKPTVIGINWLHLITDSNANPNINRNTAYALANLLDICKSNKNIAIIGIIDENRSITEHLWSRFNDIQKIKHDDENIFRKHTLGFFLRQLPHDCDDSCKEKIAKMFKSTSFSVIKDLILNAHQKAIANGQAIIQEKDLKLTVKEYVEVQKNIFGGK